MRKRREWTDEEKRILWEMTLAGRSVEECSQVLKAPVCMIYKKRRIWGIKSPRAWKNSEEQKVIETYENGGTAADAAKAIGRSVSAVYSRAPHLMAKSGRPSKWSEEEQNKLIELAETYPTQILFKVYNNWAVDNGYIKRSHPSLGAKARALCIDLKLQYSTEYFTTDALRVLFGCSSDVAITFVESYEKELKPEKVGRNGTICISRGRLKKVLKHFPSLVAKFQATMDVNWLWDILFG